MSTTSTIVPGTRCLSVARDGAKMAKCGNGVSVPVWIVGVYEARARLRDGVVTWRRVGSLGRSVSCGRGSPRSLHIEATSMAAAMGLVTRRVRHGDRA